MTRRHLLLPVLGLLCLPTAAQAQKTVTLKDVGLSLALPPGFSQWSARQIGSKFPAARPPKYVFARDARGRVSIAVTTDKVPLKDDELPRLRGFLEQVYGKFPGIQWIKREYVDRAGKRWIHLEFITKAVDTTIHNDLYVHLRGGSFVGVNYNSITSLWDQNKAALQKSSTSLRVLP